MTCIVGLVDKGRVWIGGDSAAVDGDSFGIVCRADKKPFANGPYIFGFAGSFRLSQLVAFSFAPPNPPHDQESLFGFMVTDFINGVRECLKIGGVAERKDDVEAHPGSFLVGIRGRLFVVHEDYQVGESSHGFDAIGCGDHIALGALHASKHITDPKKRIGAALIAAETFSAGVRSPFHIIGESNVASIESERAKRRKG